MDQFDLEASDIESRAVAGEWKCNEPRPADAATCKACGASDYLEEVFGPFRITVSIKDGEERLVKVEDFMETVYTITGPVCTTCGNDDADLWDVPWESDESNEE